MNKRVLSIVVLISFLTVPAVQAKTLTQAIKDIKIEETATNFRTGTEKAGDVLVIGIKVVLDGVKHGVYYATKGVMHVIATPFYWLEKVKK